MKLIKIYGLLMALMSSSVMASPTTDGRPGHIPNSAEKGGGELTPTPEAPKRAMPPHQDATLKHLRLARESSMNGIPDGAAVRFKRKSGRKILNVLDSQTHERREREAEGFNVIWNVIQQNELLKRANVADLLITLVGTVILKREGDVYQTTHLKSQGINPRFIHNLLHGGALDLYWCGVGVRCASPKQVQLKESFFIDTSLVKRISILLQSIITKRNENTVLEIDEITLLRGTNLPITQLITHLKTDEKSNTSLQMTRYSEIIARDVFAESVLGVLELLNACLANFRHEGVSQETLKSFQKTLQTVRAHIIDEQIAGVTHMNELISTLKSASLVNK